VPATFNYPKDACRSLALAADLMRQSAELLEEVMQIAADTAVFGSDIVSTINSLSLRSNAKKIMIFEEGEYLVELKLAAGMARAFVRQGGTASLQIHKLLGRENSPSLNYSWVPDDAALNLSILNSNLQNVAKRVTSVSATLRPENPGVTSIAKTIDGMAELTRCIISVAIKSANATDELNCQVLKFIRKAEQIGL